MRKKLQCRAVARTGLKRLESQIPEPMAWFAVIRSGSKISTIFPVDPIFTQPERVRPVIRLSRRSGGL